MKIKNLRLETGYLVEPIPLQKGISIHQIQIATIGEQGSSRVRISLDSNRCTVDSFGEAKACTRVAPIQLEADVELLEECDEKQLLALKFEGGNGPALRLALLPLQRGQARPSSRGSWSSGRPGRSWPSCRCKGRRRAA